MVNVVTYTLLAPSQIIDFHIVSSFSETEETWSLDLKLLWTSVSCARSYNRFLRDCSVLVLVFFPVALQWTLSIFIFSIKKQCCLFQFTHDSVNSFFFLFATVRSWDLCQNLLCTFHTQEHSFLQLSNLHVAFWHRRWHNQVVKY
jgi:hypothetical protein